MQLNDAWEERKKLWAEGSRLVDEGNKLWKEIAALPGSVNVEMWFGLSENSAEAAMTVSKGYDKRAAADFIWHNAIVEAKGKKARLTWTYDDKAKGYNCVLDSGEEFKA